MLQRFTPPGHLGDLTSNPQLQGWSDRFIHEFITEEIKSVRSCVGAGKVQFVDPLVRDLGGDTRVISWTAFPIALLSQGLTRQQALERADDPTAGRGVQDEYLEWFIHRDPHGEILAVDFTCEGPEYWAYLSEALSRQEFEKAYRIANPNATANALFDASGRYDPSNQFNTTKGIMHLTHGANTLGAEIDIVAQSTMWRDHQPVVSCRRCHDSNRIGDSHRKSDPTIASNVNQLARDGRAITIADPVGLYIGGLDTSGWTTPDGSDPQILFKIVRGNPGVRARFEVPNNTFPVSKIKIGGEAIRFAGQIAEHISIQVTAIVGPRNEFPQEPTVPCTAAGPFAVAAAGLTPAVSRLAARSHA